MKSQLPNLAVYRSEPCLLEAAHYNRVRLLLSHGDSPQWELLGGHGVEFRLERNLWLCIDRRLNDAPLLAWTDFDAVRHSLHAPLRCRRILYSAYAGIMANRVLADLARRVTLRLAQQAAAPRRAQVVPFQAGR